MSFHIIPVNSLSTQSLLELRFSDRLYLDSDRNVKVASTKKVLVFNASNVHV